MQLTNSHVSSVTSKSPVKQIPSALEVDLKTSLIFCPSPELPRKFWCHAQTPRRPKGFSLGVLHSPATLLLRVPEGCKILSDKQWRQEAWHQWILVTHPLMHQFIHPSAHHPPVHPPSIHPWIYYPTFISCSLLQNEKDSIFTHGDLQVIQNSEWNIYRLWTISTSLQHSVITIEK